MAKYRQASEKTISRGKGKSTDQLSLADAKEYFNTRAKDTGSKKFRWNGEVYDLSGNKVANSTPTRSSGSRPSAGAKPTTPKANPRRSKEGPSFERSGRGGDVENLADPKGTQWSHLNNKPKPKEANPAVVGAMAAGAVGAGIAAARSGRTKTTGGGNAATGRLAPPPARLALPAPTRGGTVIPPASKPKALPAPKPPVENSGKPKPKAKPKAKGGKTGGTRSGVRGGIGIDITTSPLEQIRDPLNLMNKGGMVKKKAKC